MRRCDIVMVAWNQLEYTKQCVKSILDCTDVPARLIIIDNGSQKDTREYLRSLRPAGSVAIKLIFNDTNIGAIKARNQGIREFDADYLCLIDNDIEVTPGWLSGMIGLAELNPDIGAVNPSSNNFGQIPSPGMELNEYAKSLGPLAGRYLEIGTAISFCMLVRGEAVRKIGCLDEAFETMFYEDTDYSMRINQEGYKCVLQKDVYVWHHGHKTSSKLKRGRELFDRNRDIFCKKWGKPLRVILCGNATAGAEAFRNALATSIELARDGNYVYLVAAPDNISGSREEIFGRYDFIEHANVHFISGPARGFGWFCLWRLLLKRKKRYDLAIAQDSRVASLMGKFGFLHGAKVLAAFDFDAALEAVHDLKFR